MPLQGRGWAQPRGWVQIARNRPFLPVPSGVFEIPIERRQNKPQKRNQNSQWSHRCESEEKKKAKRKVNPNKAQ